MNHYGALAQSHWQQHLPSRYARLADPQTFFNSLGNQISEMVQTLTDSQMSRERNDLNAMQDLERIGRINAIRKSAEEQAFAELIWPEGSTSEESPEDSSDPRRWSLQKREAWLAQQGIVNLPQGGLMPADPNHPLWSGWDRVLVQPIDLPDQDWEDWKTTWQQWANTLPHQVRLLN